MEVLVLGGTSFVGRWIVADLLAHGHTPTLFTRGVTDPGAFPGVRHLVGDRSTGDYTALADDRYDALVDVSGYVPRHVSQALDAVADRVGRYLFISTVSVYDIERCPESGLDESAPLLAEVRDTEDATGPAYGGLKVACERDLTARLGDRLTVVRPGIVAGPHDPTDRFTDWARRAAAGGRVAVPGRLDQPVQVVDARDLGRLCGLLLEQDRAGTYNGVGPADPVTLGGLVETCAQVAGATVELVPVAPVEKTPGFPLCLDDPAWDRMFRASAAAARALGMPATPLATTAADTRAWDDGRGRPPIARGFDVDREAALLAGA